MDEKNIQEGTVNKSFRIKEDVKERLEVALESLGGATANESVAKLLDKLDQAEKIQAEKENSAKSLNINEDMETLMIAMDNINSVTNSIQTKANIYAQRLELQMKDDRVLLEEIKSEYEKEIEDAIEGIVIGIEIVKGDNEHLKNQVEDLEEKNKSLINDRDQLKNELEDSLDMIKVYKDNLESAKKDKESALCSKDISEKRESASLEKQRELEQQHKLDLELLEDLEKVKHELVETKRELEDANKKIEDGKEQLKLKEEKISELNKEIISSITKMQKENKTEIKAMQNKLDKIKEDKYNIEMELNILKVNLDATKKKEK